MRAVDVFCGAGGLSAGLQRAGMEIVGAFDAWDVALKVYRRNVAGCAWCHDVWDVVTIAPKLMDLAPDIICAGPPCQDFSKAGPRVEGRRAELLVAFAMTVAAVRPEWLLIENVPRAQSSAAWARSRDVLKRSGYGLTQVVVNASWYGVAQTRKRLIVIGRLSEADGFLDREIVDARQSRQTTVRDILGTDIGRTLIEDPQPGGRDTEPLGLENVSGSGEFYFIRPFGRGRGVRSIDEPAPGLARTSREAPVRGYLAKPSPLDPVPADQVPHLTQAQTARLQGFPADWDWTDATRVRDLDQLIVNAVPLPLAEAIGHVILARHVGESIPDLDDGFSAWLRRTGVSGQVLRNRRHAVRRARRLLSGRVFADLGEELSALESVPEFARLSPSTRSDLRAALRKHAEWRKIAQGKSKGKGSTSAGKSQA